MALAGTACCYASLLPIITAAQARTGIHAGQAAWSWSAPPGQGHDHGDRGRGSGPESSGQGGGSTPSSPTSGGAQPQDHSQGGGGGAQQGGGWSHGSGGGGHEGGWGGHGGAGQGSEQPSASPEAQGDGGNHGRGHGNSGNQGGGHDESGQSGESSQGGGDWTGNTQQSNSYAHGHGGSGQGAQAQDTSSSSSNTSKTVQSSPAATAPASSGQTPTVAASAGSSPASSAPAATSSTPTAPATGGATHAAARKPRGHRGRRGGKTSSKGASRKVAGRGRSKTPGALAAATAAAAGGAAAAHQTPAVHHPRAKRGSTQASRLPPVVRTITKIVSVVPLPLRILIGVLVALAIGLAARSRLAARRAKRLEQQRGALLADVGLLQAALLPGSPQRLGTVGTSTAYRPASGPAAGGDFYDLFALEDGRLAAIVGDVSGHGRQALPHTALTRFTLRAYLEAGFSPRESLATAGAALERQLGDSFATVAIATYQPRDRTLTYACAGHPQPMVLGSEPLAAVSAASAPPIGAGMQTGTRQSVISLPGAARVCLHTDGVTDARIGTELYGMQRLTRALAELGPDAGAEDLLDRVAAQTDAQPDDMAACLLDVPGGAESPRVLREELKLDAEQAQSARAEQFLLACGVPQRHVAGILGAAREEALRGGSALLEVRPAQGTDEPTVLVRPDNVAAIDAVKVRRELAGAR